MRGARESKRAKKEKAPEARERYLETLTGHGDRAARWLGDRAARWLARPRIDTGMFEDVARDEELVAKFGAKIVVPPEVSERARELNDLMDTLGLSGERRALFKQLVIAYHRERTIESYIQIRRKFREVEIQISRIGGIGGIDALFALKEHFEKQGVPLDLVAPALDSNEPSLDALSLRLLECLVARSKLPKDGVAYNVRRRGAISDATVNYLILLMLENLDRNDLMVRVPASLIVLILHQLSAGTPELHQTFLSNERRQAAAFRAAQWFKPGEKISVRKLASVTGVPRSTAARYLADEKFQKSLQAFQHAVATGLIQELRESWERRRASQ